MILDVQRDPKIDVKLTCEFYRFSENLCSRLSSILKALKTSKSRSCVGAVSKNIHVGQIACEDLCFSPALLKPIMTKSVSHN